MNEFIKKLIERLNAKLPLYACGWRKEMNEIVNQLAEEYKHCTLCYLQSPCEYQNAEARLPISEFADSNRWIPVSSGRLPETKEVYFDILDITTALSDFVWVTLANGELIEANIEGGHWYSVAGNLVKEEVIAWKPNIRPAPYQPKGE